jgi:hypothetical protein
MNRCTVIPVRFYVFTGFEFIAGRAKILVFSLRAQTDCASCTVRGDKFHIGNLAAQADKVDLIIFPIAIIFAHFYEQRLITCYRPNVGRTFFTMDAAIRYHGYLLRHEFCIFSGKAFCLKQMLFT